MTVKCVRTVFLGLAVFAVSGALALAAKKPEAAKPTSMPSPSSTASTSTAETGVVATVGDQKITESDLMASLPPDRQRAFEGAAKRIDDIQHAAVEEIFADRYAQDQAKAKGMSVDDYYKQEIASNQDGFPSEYKVQIAQVKQQIYDAKKMAVDELVGKKLEEKAAKDKGVTVEALEKTEVEDKVAAVTPADVDQFYAQNQRQFGGQSKDAVAKQIEDTVHNRRIDQKRTEFRASLRNSAAVRTYLEVPRIPVSVDDDPTRGSKQAPIQIVMFSDFQCPFCSRVETTMKQIKDTYGDKVAITFRDFPLSFHQNAQKAAEAANCADKQGKYWEFHDALFANQGQLSVPDLKKKAEELGLNMAQFNQCLDSGDMKAEIDKDVKEGSGYGVTGTPAAFVNGRFMSGAQPFDSFKKVIDDELQMKGIPVPTVTTSALTPSANQ